jgi:predicted anti-sigma-YlaC factor YlaD
MEYLAAAAIDFTLAPGEQVVMDLHLAACASCRAMAAAYAADASALREIAFVTPPARVAAAVFEAAARPAVRALRALRPRSSLS